MCGITGWLDWQRDLTEQGTLVEAMADTLKRRGPDAGGVWLAPRVGLAHRRLIVIDPNGGVQPMVRKLGERTYAITYNGELYNFRELRQELETRGHVFESRSDTEVLLRSYIEWGPACVEKFNGIFAFAIWDENEQTLFLGRDHLGVKPMFYAQRGSSFLFGSEIKALLANPLVKPELDQDGLTELLSMGVFRTPGHGVYRGVSELLPGHTLLVTRNGVRVTQYWKLESREHTADYATTVQQVRELLEDAVTRQLVSDVPISTMLSGGLDSSGVSAIAARAFREEGRQLDTYSLQFVDEDRDFKANPLHRDLDAPWAKKVADSSETNHHIILLDSPELLQDIYEPMRARDLPATGDIETSLYTLFKRMKPDVTVALSGESADEVFGGYPWYYVQEMRNVNTFPWMALGGGNIYDSMRGDVLARMNLAEYKAERYQQALSEVPRLAGESAEDARTREIFYLNITRFLSYMLDRKDRMSMAASLEVRVPFCDYRLVEYMWNVPWEMKFHGGVEKGLLRDAFSHVLPEDVVRRRKTAYPVTHNPNYINGVRAKVREIVEDSSSPIFDLYDREQVRKMAYYDGPVGSGFMSEKNYYDHIIQVDAWMREYKISLV
ncbi:asparagine synthase (glutamine-hydrolyzing) [Tumebacillus sp. ITR2]|uniref:asparagine synthase (glutamine-hydrolyzing) n=1 Tax=Tumebacillus amylolyticus TaxID=2801339 RepID=A0ABS1J6S9_9BACL|nr:asparagine synthase (glutamine-hydrolyzing) [Tumebacillus amylolyticus]MBL0385988.1 asparagine synthase (glutamine-hydrolyzing) [Tumebacillus amylolyticus]